MKLFFLTKILNDMPIGFLIVWSAINNYVIVGSMGLETNLLNTASDIKLMIEPRSYKSLSKSYDLIVQGINEASGSPFFCISEQDIIALQWWKQPVGS